MIKYIFILHFMIGVSITEGCRNEACTYLDLPPAFDLDDNDYCRGTYCLVEYQINTSDNVDSKIIKFIQEYSSNSYAHFNRTLLRRGVCLEECMRHSNMSSDIEDLLVECENKKLKEKYNMSVTVKDIEICKEKGESYPVDILDYAFGAFVIVLIAVVFVATYTDNEKTNETLKSFSLKKNWPVLVDNNDSDQKFQFLNGLKFLIMCCVIASHILLLFIMGYPANPQYLEKLFESKLDIILNASVLMQSFFIMSAFLNTYNFLSSNDGKVFSINDLLINILRRWCRFMPTLIFMVLFVSTWLSRLENDAPVWWKMVETERNGCRIVWWRHILLISNLNYFDPECMGQAWWRHILLISNLNYFDPECMGQAWSVAADMHLTALSLCVLMIIWRHPMHKISLVTLLIFGFVILGYQTYTYSLSPILFVLNPENLRNLFVGDESFLRNYASTQANIAAYVFGMITAFLYRDMELGRKSITDHKIFQTLKPWSLCMCTISVCSGIYFYPRASYEYDILEAIIFVIGTIFVYDFGFCILLLRLLDEKLSEEKKSPIRKFLEHPWMTILGRLTYSALMVHVVVIATNLGQIQTPVYYSNYLVNLQIVTTMVMTYIYATPLHLFVELPFYNLQKIYLGKRKVKKQEHTSIDTKLD